MNSIRMYGLELTEKLGNNLVDILKPEATTFVFNNDRALYFAYFKALEKYISDNKIVIGGDFGNELLLGIPANKNSFVWYIYVYDNVHKHAREMAHIVNNVTANHLPNNLCVLQTLIEHQEFVLWYNGREIAHIFALRNTRSIDLETVLAPIKIMGIFGNEVLVMNHKIQLISCYRSIYNLTGINNLDTLFKTEENLFNIRPGARVIQKNNTVTWPGDIDFVVIGDYAIKHYLGGDVYRLQIICDLPPATIARSFGPNAYAVMVNTVLPDDWQLRKYTIYQKEGNRQVALCDIYNSSAYELIPYIQAERKIGAPIVILRFLMLELWIITIMQSMGVNVGRRLDYLTYIIAEFRAFTFRKLREDPLYVMPTDNYAGIFVYDSVAKKKSKKKWINDYYPLHKNDSIVL